MSIVTFYRGDPRNAPRTTMPAHLGANILITCGDRLLLEKRSDSDIWGLVGGGVKKTETPQEAAARETLEELGLRFRKEDFRKLDVYDDPGRIAAYRDGSVWRMVIVVFELGLDEEPLMKLSSESKDLRFFSRSEIQNIDIAITHSDIITNWFLNNGIGRNG